MISNFIKNVYFLVNVTCTITYEIGKYYLFGDFSNLIDNLSDKLSKKNILYVKIFQACALNNNILNDEINNKLLKFTDNAPWTEEDIDNDTLTKFETEFNINIEDKSTPINSGMISLVFKGINTKTNEELIIKIKRKNIENKLEDGIEKLLFFLKIVDLIPYVNNYDLPNIIHKNINLIKHQTDFSQEVINIQRFSKLCENLKYIKIPLVYDKVTTVYPDIILMEYIRGKTIFNIEKEEYEIYAKQIINFFSITTFIHGVVHGDLHLGNILFIKDDKKDEKYKNKICILDFGIIYEIGETRNALFDIFTDMCSISPEILAKKILYSGLIEPLDVIKTLPTEHYNSMIKIIMIFVNVTIHIDKRLHQINIFKFLKDLNYYINNNNINGLKLKASDDLVKIQVIFGMLHGVILTLLEGKDYIKFTDNVINETFHLDLLKNC